MQNSLSGKRTSFHAENVDVFPTLVDLAGLRSVRACPQKMDNSQIDLCTEGKSLAPLVEANGSSRLKDTGALVQTKRPKQIMGYSIMTQGYRQVSTLYEYSILWQMQSTVKYTYIIYINLKLGSGIVEKEFEYWWI